MGGGVGEVGGGVSISGLCGLSFVCTVLVYYYGDGWAG